MNTYKMRGVEFTVNDLGCLISCSDWESIYPSQPGEPGKEHYGENSDLFVRGYGDRFWATDAFKVQAILIQDWRDMSINKNMKKRK